MVSMLVSLFLLFSSILMEHE